MKYSLLLLPLLVLGCVSTQNIPAEDRSRTYDLDYDIVFDATVQMLAEKGFAIIDAQRDEGIINTDYRAEDRLFSFFSGPTRRKVSALISNTSDGTQILLNFDLQEFVDQSPGGGDGIFQSQPRTPRVARRYYREFLTALESYLPEE